MKLTVPKQIIPARTYDAPEIGELRQTGPGAIRKCIAHDKKTGTWIGQRVPTIYDYQDRDKGIYEERNDRIELSWPGTTFPAGLLRKS